MIRVAIVAALAVTFLPSGLVAQEDVRVSVMADPEGNRMIFRELSDGTVQTLDEQSGEYVAVNPNDVPRLSAKAFPGGAGFSPAAGPKMDIAQMRQEIAKRAVDSLKAALGCTEEEWAVLWPKIQTVQLLQSVIGERSKGLNVALDGIAPTVKAIADDVRIKQQEFAAAVNQGFAQSELRQCMTRLREARARAREELNQVRKDLTGLLTVYQEAVLMQRQILD